MTTRTVGVTEVAKWCGVVQSTVSMWMARHDDYPQPDVTVHTGRNVTRGWLPERKAEWMKYAKTRAASPGALLVAQRTDRRSS